MIVDQDRQVFLSDWGGQRVLRIDPMGVVNLMNYDSADFGPEGLAFSNGGLVVFESLRPHANQGILPRILTFGRDGAASVIYHYSAAKRNQ